MKNTLTRFKLIIGHSSFRVGDRWYRTKGFYHIHVFPGGEKLMAGTSKWKATHVSGYGVAGTIVPFDEIEEVSYRYRPDHRKHDLYGWKRVTGMKLPYKEIKVIPEDMTKDEWDTQWMDKILDKAIPSKTLGNKYLWWFDWYFGYFLMKPGKYIKYMKNTYGENYHIKPK